MTHSKQQKSRKRRPRKRRSRNAYDFTNIVTNPDFLNITFEKSKNPNKLFNLQYKGRRYFREDLVEETKRTIAFFRETHKLYSRRVNNRAVKSAKDTSKFKSLYMKLRRGYTELKRTELVNNQDHEVTEYYIPFPYSKVDVSDHYELNSEIVRHMNRDFKHMAIMPKPVFLNGLHQIRWEQRRQTVAGINKLLERAATDKDKEDVKCFVDSLSEEDKALFFGSNRVDGVLWKMEFCGRWIFVEDGVSVEDEHNV